MKKIKKNSTKKMPRKPRGKFSRFLIHGVVVITAIVFAFAIWVFGIASPIRENVFYNVAPGATISGIARDMFERGLIENEDLFIVSVLFQGGRIQMGEYELDAGSSVYKIANMFNRGRVATITVVIPEGLTVKQIANLLNDTAALTGKTNSDYKDGELFPDTYRVARGAPRSSVMDLMKRKMDSVRIGWENSRRSVPKPLKSWNEIITLASIVQKETPRESEMPMVASVYLNRLNKKMKLQADPTVVYAITNGLGDMQGAGLFTKHLQTPHPFNTYANYGLPPAPIANVGRSAIAAVLNPADTTYLFFVADGTGGHKFSHTYTEHQKNQALWRKIKNKK